VVGLTAHEFGARSTGIPTWATRTVSSGSAASDRIVAGKALTDVTEFAERKTAWAEAGRTTPHGNPH